MMQNHLLQLLCLIAMEPPVTFDAEAVRDEKNKVMQAVRPIDPERVDEVAVRGQYGAGFVEGRQVPGYRAGEGRRPGLDHRDLRGAAAARSTTGGGPGCRSTCAPASAWPSG